MEQATGTSNQLQLSGLRALIEVGGIALLDPVIVSHCHTLQQAIWLSTSRQITGRRRTHQDYADALGMSRCDYTKKVNGGNLPQGWLVKLARITGNALPLQWQAAQLGFELFPLRQQAPQQQEQQPWAQHG